MATRGKPVELNRIPRDPVERLEDPLAQYNPADVRAVVAEVKELREALEVIYAENKQTHNFLVQAQRELDDTGALLDQIVDVVYDLHHPVQVTLYDGAVRWVCDHCNTGDPYCTVSNDWPCPTVKSIQQYTGEEDDE